MVGKVGREGRRFYGVTWCVGFTTWARSGWFLVLDFCLDSLSGSEEILGESR